MRKIFLFLIASVFAGGLAQAQQPAATTPTRVAGAIESLTGDDLTVAGRDGAKATVRLSSDAKIWGLEKRRLSDIKPGDFVASGGVRGTDGKIHAVEVRIFPEALRGSGEGQRPWDVRPEGVMTNATVGTVSQAGSGGVIHVTYKGGESEYIVDPDVPVLTYVAADRALLKPGAMVMMIAQKAADGTLRADRVTAEKDGVKPPM
ncbi:MAG: hypothetical protein JO001_29295 [Alphaproteobacteria bacterium]|nr:hypothetical protein [Alphaproteobacteria bacterium]